MAQLCHAPIGCFTTTKIFFRFIFQNFSPSDNTLFYNQHNAIYSLQQRNTVDVGRWS